MEVIIAMERKEFCDNFEGFLAIAVDKLIWKAVKNSIKLLNFCELILFVHSRFRYIVGVLLEVFENFNTKRRVGVVWVHIIYKRLDFIFDGIHSV